MRLKGTFLTALPFVVFLILCITRILDQTTKDLNKTTPSVQIEYFSLPPVRHATKSLADLGPMDELSGHILFFNRIPKSGSEMLLLLIQWLQGWNNFRHVRLKDDGKPKINRSEQEKLVNTIQDRIKEEAIPLCFDKPVHFINFTSFEKQSPTYVNLIRDPADIFVSRYHFKKTTANPLDRYFTATVENKLPIEKCIEIQNLDCSFQDDQAYDFSIPYFCGQDDRCMLHNNHWALTQAKSNVERYFPVVGVLEEVNTTLEVFEKKLPFFFRGVRNMYYRDLLEPYHISDRRKQLKVSAFVKEYLRKQLKTEYEFYEWIKNRLFQLATT